VIGSPDADSVDFLNDFKTSFLAEEIYVYTPRGDVKMLPAGSTALDFAFYIHSAIGSKTIGAKVNHKLVPIGHKLRSGDQIEIITSNKQKPHEDWLNLVITAKAKSKIKDSLKEEKRKIADDGKYILQKKLEGMKAAVTPGNVELIAQFYKLSSSLDLYYNIAIKNIDLKELKDFQVHGDRLDLPRPKQPEHKPHEQQAEQHQHKHAVPSKDTELIIFGESGDQFKYTLANCCKPIPGDDVFGFITATEGLKIHRTSCPNAARLLANYGHRVVKTKWAKNKDIAFLTGIKIIGLDDVGVINKITNIISGDMRININALTIESRDGLFEGNIKVYVHDKEELNELVSRLKNLRGIQTVDRFEPEENK
jgi:GTP pyrophosphokinase